MNLPQAQEYFVSGLWTLYQYMDRIGLPISFHSYYRGNDEQNRLYAEGKSKARGGESPHNYGLAADYHFAEYGWNVPDNYWVFVDQLVRQVGIESGVKFNDGNHLQLIGWKQWKPIYV